jgi:hypothetical protein
LSGKSVQVILPAVVSMIAVGFSAEVGDFALVLGFAAGFAWAHAIEPANEITPIIANVLRMNTP